MFHQIAPQYIFNTLCSQRKYLKVPVENSYFSSWVTGGEKTEDFPILINSKILFKENGHSPDDTNVSFLRFLTLLYSWS